RGVLHDETKKAGCNKLALGHHMDDAVETFLMNLFIEARIACFQPVSYLSVKDITMFRPMIYMPEKEAVRVVAQNNLPLVKSLCPIDGQTRRQRMKEFIAAQNAIEPGFKERIFHAMVKGHISDW
ncbi:MAG: ATP-binding protein, partial [Oscillospiraceae bacterium]